MIFIIFLEIVSDTIGNIKDRFRKSKSSKIVWVVVKGVSAKKFNSKLIQFKVWKILQQRTQV